MVHFIFLLKTSHLKEYHKAIRRDMSRRLGLRKTKGAHLHVNYIYNSLEVAGEEYSFFVFLVHKEPHKIRTHVIDPSRRRVWLLENDIRINKSRSIVIFGSELSHLEPTYSESIDKYVCKDYYYIDMLESLIKTKKYLQTKAANE